MRLQAYLQPMRHHVPNLASTSKKPFTSLSAGHLRSRKKVIILFIMKRERLISELPARSFKHMLIADTLLLPVKYQQSCRRLMRHWGERDTSLTARTSKYGWSCAMATKMDTWSMKSTSTSWWGPWIDQASPFISDDIFSKTVIQ